MHAFVNLLIWGCQRWFNWPTHVSIENPPMTCQYLSLQSCALHNTVWPSFHFPHMPRFGCNGFKNGKSTHISIRLRVNVVLHTYDIKSTSARKDTGGTQKRESLLAVSSARPLYWSQEHDQYVSRLQHCIYPAHNLCILPNSRHSVELQMNCDIGSDKQQIRL